MMSLMDLPKQGGGGWSGGGAPLPKRRRFDEGQSASGGEWSQPVGPYDQAEDIQDYGARKDYSDSYGLYDEPGWNQPTSKGSGYGVQLSMNTEGRRRGAATAPQQRGGARPLMSTSYGDSRDRNDCYDDTFSEHALHQQQNLSRGRRQGFGPQAQQQQQQQDKVACFEYDHEDNRAYNEHSDNYGSGYRSGVAQKRKLQDPFSQHGDNYEPLSLLTETFSAFGSDGSGMDNARDVGAMNLGPGTMRGQGANSDYSQSRYSDNNEEYYEQNEDQCGYNTRYWHGGRGQGPAGRGLFGRRLAGHGRGGLSEFGSSESSFSQVTFSDIGSWDDGQSGGMQRGRRSGLFGSDSAGGTFGGIRGHGMFGSGGQRGRGSFSGQRGRGSFSGDRGRDSFGGTRGRASFGDDRGHGTGRARGQATPLMGAGGPRGGARWARVSVTPRPGAPGSTLALSQRFKNLCMIVKKSPRIALASSSLESFLADDSVCLAPAYVFKGERREETQPFSFNCKVYINNVYIANAMATNKKDSKNRACDAALQVLSQKSAMTILNEHERVDVSALGKQDADIVECALKSSESNIGNVLAKVSGGNDKSIADFYILEPEHVDEATGMNSTCILRQSADFSHLLLKYEFTTSPMGFVCSVNIEGKTLARATAAQQNLAKNSASHIALQNLRKNNWTIHTIKHEKPKPAPEALTKTLGRVLSTTDRPAFIAKIRDHLSEFFNDLKDHTKWLSLSAELNREERDCVYSVSKELELRVETKRVDGGRGPVGDDDTVFLVVSKKMSCQDLFDYIWEKGGETWRYKLRPPSQFKVPSGKSS